MGCLQRKAFTLDPDGNRAYVEPANGKYWTLKEEPAFVGGYIEHHYLDNGMVMVMNEDGLRLNLKPNMEAEMIMGPETHNGHVVGTVLVTPQELID